jgi:hypothetical protein
MAVAPGDDASPPDASWPESAASAPSGTASAPSGTASAPSGTASGSESRRTNPIAESIAASEDSSEVLSRAKRARAERANAPASPESPRPRSSSAWLGRQALVAWTYPRSVPSIPSNSSAPFNSPRLERTRSSIKVCRARSPGDSGGPIAASDALRLHQYQSGARARRPSRSHAQCGPRILRRGRASRSSSSSSVESGNTDRTSTAGGRTTTSRGASAPATSVPIENSGISICSARHATSG